MAVVALLAMACLGWAIARPSAMPTTAGCAETWDVVQHSSEVAGIDRRTFIADCLGR